MNLIQLFEAIAKLTKAEHGMGMSSYQNDDILLTGGFRSGNSDSEHTRLKYIVYDIKGLSKEEFNATPTDHELGFVEVFVLDSSGKIDGLVNIELKTKFRKGGYGKKILQSLIKTTGGKLKIFDIKANAIPFWKKVGVTVWYNSSTFEERSKIEDKPTLKNLKVKAKRHSLYGMITK